MTLVYMSGYMFRYSPDSYYIRHVREYTYVSLDSDSSIYVRVHVSVFLDSEYSIHIMGYVSFLSG